MRSERILELIQALLRPIANWRNRLVAEMHVLIRSVATSLLILQLGSGLGIVQLWGLHYLKLFPVWLIVSLTISVITLVWLPFKVVRNALEHLGKLCWRAAPRGELLYLLPTAAVLFVLLRSQNLLMGDGYKRLEMMSRPLEFWPSEYGDLLVHRWLTLIFDRPELAYLITGVVCGLLFLLVVCAFARELTSNCVARFASALMVFGLAQSQFFFGYVESYTIVFFLAASFLYFGWKSLHDSRWLKWSLVSFVFSGLFHLSGWFLLPGLIYLLLFHAQRTGNARYIIASICVGAASLAVFIAFMLNSKGQGVFVPLLSTELNPYSLLSSSHLVDLANILLLGAAIPTVVSVVLLFSGVSHVAVRDHGCRFFFFALLGACMILIGVDPVLGAFRDWDLLSLYGLPLSFLACLLVKQIQEKPRILVSVAAAALAFLVLHTAPWIISNCDKIGSKDLMKQVVKRDVHYSSDYRDGILNLAWAYHLQDVPFNDYEEARRAYGERLKAKQDDFYARVPFAKMSYLLDDRQGASDALHGLKFLIPQSEMSIDVARLYLRIGNMSDYERTVEWMLDHGTESAYFAFHRIVIQTMHIDTSRAIDFLVSAVMNKTDRVGLATDAAALAMNLGKVEYASVFIELAEKSSDVAGSDTVDIFRLKERLRLLQD